MCSIPLTKRERFEAVIVMLLKFAEGGGLHFERAEAIYEEITRHIQVTDEEFFTSALATIEEIITSDELQRPEVWPEFPKTETTDTQPEENPD